MTAQQDVFAYVIEVLEKLQIPYMIGGSVAAIAYGRARLTLDMDLVVDMNKKQVEQFVRSFGPEYYVNLDSILEAIKNKGHFNIIQSEKGVKVDFYILKDDEFNRLEFSRRRQEAFDETKQAMFTTPEDVIVKKLEWHKMGESQKHLDDIKGIVEISRDKLDYAYIDKWALKLGLQDTWEKVKT